MFYGHSFHVRVLMFGCQPLVPVSASHYCISWEATCGSSSGVPYYSPERPWLISWLLLLAQPHPSCCECVVREPTEGNTLSFNEKNSSVTSFFDVFLRHSCLSSMFYFSEASIDTGLRILLSILSYCSHRDRNLKWRCPYLYLR